MFVHPLEDDGPAPLTGHILGRVDAESVLVCWNIDGADWEVVEYDDELIPCDHHE